jgi:ABC-type Fe3+/spermidine/putrescine transport system ATPase subunit
VAYIPDDMATPSSKNARVSLTVGNLFVRYGGYTAVNDVSFEVGGGTILGIIGPSGAGKSSILAALTGLIASTGVVRFDGTDLGNRPPQQRRFANVYQDHRLYDWMTLAENVAFPCRAQRWPPHRTAIAVDRLLREFGLSDRADRPARLLSGGEAQRAALARALVFEPRALLLDEPFSDLDPPLRGRLRDHVAKLVRERGIPTILVTHDRDEALSVCDRLGILINGVLRQCGAPPELLDNPADSETAEFLGYANSMNGTVTQLRGGVIEFKANGRRWIGRSGNGRQFAEGEHVRALFRPADVLPAGNEPPDAPNGVSTTCLQVTVTEHVRRIALAAPATDPWVAHWPMDLPVTPGSTVHCRIAPERLLVYL